MKWNGEKKKCRKATPLIVDNKLFLVKKYFSLSLSSFWVCRIEFISNDKLVGERSPQLFRSRERRHNFSEFSHRNEIFVVVLRVSSWWWKCGKSQKEKKWNGGEKNDENLTWSVLTFFVSHLYTIYSLSPPSLLVSAASESNVVGIRWHFHVFFLSFTKKSEN